MTTDNLLIKQDELSLLLGTFLIIVVAQVISTAEKDVTIPKRLNAQLFGHNNAEHGFSLPLPLDF